MSPSDVGHLGAVAHVAFEPGVLTLEAGKKQSGFTKSLRKVSENGYIKLEKKKGGGGRKHISILKPGQGNFCS